MGADLSAEVTAGVTQGVEADTINGMTQEGANTNIEVSKMQLELVIFEYNVEHYL